MDGNKSFSIETIEEAATDSSASAWKIHREKVYDSIQVSRWKKARDGL